MIFWISKEYKLLKFNCTDTINYATPRIYLYMYIYIQCSRCRSPCSHLANFLENLRMKMAFGEYRWRIEISDFALKN